MECGQVGELDAILDARLPDSSCSASRGARGGEMLNAARRAPLTQGPAASARGIHAPWRRSGARRGARHRNADLATPFQQRAIARRHRLSAAGRTPPNRGRRAEAVRAGWLELWYQPKIGTRTLKLREAEGLIRIRSSHLGRDPTGVLHPGRRRSASARGCRISSWPGDRRLKHFVDQRDKSSSPSICHRVPQEST